ncbi:MAG: IS1595 family transposase [Candidatus Sumerlaeia bacterium]
MNLPEIFRRFPTHESCIKHLETVRWQGKPECPYCHSTNCTPVPQEMRHHCNNCNTSFRVTVQTIFHDTKLDLQKWFLAVALILNAKKGISSRQLARDLEVHRNTAWYMGMRIRKAMIQQRELLQGIAEMDECYIGGKPRKGSGGPHKRGRGTSKQPVIGIVERDGKVTAKPVKRTDSKTLSSFVRERVDVDRCKIITDEYRGYSKLFGFISHETIDHQVWYVDGDVHTNSIESFWALLKRGIIGQYHKVSVKHLHEYINEFCYRHNHRKDKTVFDNTILRAVGGEV